MLTGGNVFKTRLPQNCFSYLNNLYFGHDTVYFTQRNEQTNYSSCTTTVSLLMCLCIFVINFMYVYCMLLITILCIDNTFVMQIIILIILLFIKMWF